MKQLSSKPHAKVTQSANGKCKRADNEEASSEQERSITTNPIFQPEIMKNVQRFRLEEAHFIVFAKVASSAKDDLNRLTKKIILTSAAAKHEARFSISDGIFSGSQFHLLEYQGNLTIKVSGVSIEASHLLLSYRNELHTRLARHEINLQSLSFSFLY